MKINSLNANNRNHIKESIEGMDCFMQKVAFKPNLEGEVEIRKADI